MSKHVVIRSIDDSSNANPTLLTLPLSDFDQTEASAKNVKGIPHDSKEHEEEEEGSCHSSRDADQLVLLQLPTSSLSVSDLLSGTARIVGSTDDADEDDTGRQRQACLVVEKTGESFTLSRVETSNAYVLVPPQQVDIPTSDGDDPNSSCLSSNDGENERPRKKAKLSIMKARLLSAPGGAVSGASFLEPKPHGLQTRLLRAKLSEHVYDPYNLPESTSNFGCTVEELALDLQCATIEVERALTRMNAFQIKASDDREGPGRGQSSRYALLSEEALHDTNMAIVSALSECDELMEYTKGIPVEKCVEEAMRRLEEEAETCGGNCIDETVVRHCLRMLRVVDDDDEGDGEVMKLDVNKIALFLAHHLLNSQRKAWLRTKFLSEWQSLIPGVGESYQPNLDLLKGVAVSIPSQALASSTVDGTSNKNDDDDDGSGYLNYLPEEILSSVPEERFRRLFKEKERWTLEELEPYVTRLAEEGNLSQAEVLLRYTLMSTDEKGGEKVNWYMQRQLI